MQRKSLAEEMLAEEMLAEEREKIQSARTLKDLEQIIARLIFQKRALDKAWSNLVAISSVKDARLGEGKGLENLISDYGKVIFAAEARKKAIPTQNQNIESVQKPIAPVAKESKTAYRDMPSTLEKPVFEPEQPSESNKGLYVTIPRKSKVESTKEVMMKLQQKTEQSQFTAHRSHTDNNSYGALPASKQPSENEKIRTTDYTGLPATFTQEQLANVEAYKGLVPASKNKIEDETLSEPPTIVVKQRVKADKKKDAFAELIGKRTQKPSTQTENVEGQNNKEGPKMKD